MWYFKIYDWLSDGKEIGIAKQRKSNECYQNIVIPLSKVFTLRGGIGIGKAKLIECYDNIVTPWYGLDLKNPFFSLLLFSWAVRQKNKMH